MCDSTTLSELAEINPRTVIPADQPVSFIGMDDVSESFELKRTHDRNTAEPRQGYTRFREDDLLFAKITPCMENGKGARARGLTNGHGLGSTEFHVLRARIPEAAGFIAQWLSFSRLRLAAEAQMTGSAGQRRVPSDFFAKFAIPDFSLNEQVKIAKILDTLDYQIRETEAVISKYRLQRSGIVDRHVTRAIALAAEGAEGWFSTTLGSIVRERGGLIQTGPFGSQLHSYDYVVDGVPVVMPQDINGGRISLDAIAQVTESTARGLARHRMVPGDVVFARRGDLRRCAEITIREKGWLCGTGCLLVRPPEAVLRADWLTLVYRHEWGQRHVRANAVGSTMANLNGSILAGLQIPLPPIEDQEAATDALSVQDTRISLERQYLMKLRALKNGLMSDLLSGRVRVSTELAS